MADEIKLQVVTPDRSVVDESVRIVMAPGILGEFGVLSGHTPFLTVLNTGSMHFVDSSGKDRFLFLNGGFAEALPDRVTVLAESAERRKDIDVKRAKTAAERARSRLSGAELDIDEDSNDIDFERARASLLRAVRRIELAEMI